jgi:hypothetical protein
MREEAGVPHGFEDSVRKSVRHAVEVGWLRTELYSERRAPASPATPFGDGEPLGYPSGRACIGRFVGNAEGDHLRKQKQSEAVALSRVAVAGVKQLAVEDSR